MLIVPDIWDNEVKLEKGLVKLPGKNVNFRKTMQTIP
jgi:hypothetical protein